MTNNKKNMERLNKMWKQVGKKKKKPQWQPQR